MFSALLTLLLTTLAYAAPIADEITTAGSPSQAWKPATGGGVAGFIVLIIDIIVWVEILQSSRSIPSKILWCLGVFLFPIIGAIVYFLFSNREAHKTGAGYEAITGTA